MTIYVKGSSGEEDEQPLLFNDAEGQNVNKSNPNSSSNGGSEEKPGLDFQASEEIPLPPCLAKSISSDEENKVQEKTSFTGERGDDEDLAKEEDKNGDDTTGKGSKKKGMLFLFTSNFLFSVCAAVITLVYKKGFPFTQVFLTVSLIWLQ